MHLVIDHLNAGYGGSRVLRDISLTVAPGRICALMGRNGSGKTTLLRCINRVITPYSGKITLMGNDLSAMTRGRIARLISVVPQTAFSPFAFSCLDMVMMAGVSRLRPWGAPSAGDRDKAMSIMSETGVGHLAKKFFNAVSGGSGSW